MKKKKKKIKNYNNIKLIFIKLNVYRKYKHKVKREVDRKVNLYSRFNYRGFKRFEIIDEEELID